jgi:UDP-glucose 4-epimerase
LKLLITGSSGYIGSVLCKVAQEKGHFVIGVDTVLPKHNYYDDFIQDNINRNIVAYAGIDCDAIFHLAASADVTDSTKRPSLYYHNNLGATASMFDNLLMMGWKPKPVIFSSTAAVYGSKDTPVTESDSGHPVNAYGRSKLMCETFLYDLFTYHKIPSTTFRYFNVTGAYDDVGDHLDSHHVIQKLCYSAYNKQPFYTYGNNWSTEDGTCVRDYLHVLDVCEAHFTALEHMLKHDTKATFNTYNLGTYKGLSVKQLVDAFESTTNTKVYNTIAQSREGDPAYLVADPSKFIKETGFKYNYSDLNNIITSTWNWYRRNFDAV